MTLLRPALSDREACRLLSPYGRSDSGSPWIRKYAPACLAPRVVLSATSKALHCSSTSVGAESKDLYHGAAVLSGDFLDERPRYVRLGTPYTPLHHEKPFRFQEARKERV